MGSLVLVFDDLQLGMSMWHPREAQVYRVVSLDARDNGDVELRRSAGRSRRTFLYSRASFDSAQFEEWPPREADGG